MRGIAFIFLFLSAFSTIAQNTYTSNNATPGADFNTVGNWTGAGTPNFINGLDKFIISDGHSYTTSAAVNIEGLTIGQGGTGGSLVLNNTLDLEGNLTIDVASNLNAASNQVNIAGNWTEIGSGSLTSSGTVVFDAPLVQTISAAATFNNITLNGGGVVTTGGNITVGGNWLVNNNTTFNSANSHVLAGNLTVDDGSSYTATNGRLTLNGSVDQVLDIGQNVSFDELYFQPGVAINYTIIGDIVASDLTRVYNGATLNGSGDHTLQELRQEGVCNFDGSITFTAGQVYDNDDNAFSLGTADIFIAGNVSFSNGGNDDITIGGNLTISSNYLVLNEGSTTGSGGIFQINDGTTVYLRGVDNFPTGFGTIDFQGTTSRANYDLRSDQTIRGGISYARLALGAAAGTDTGSRIKTADAALDINGYLDLNNAVTLNLQGFSHTLEGDLFNSTNSSITNAGATLTLDAPDANQTVQTSGTGSYSIQNLNITNTAPTAVRTVNIDDNGALINNFSVTNAGGSASNYLILDIDANLMVGFGTYTVGANVELRTSGSTEFNSMMAFYNETIDPQSIVLFDGGTQTIPGITYGNVEISGNGAKNAGGGLNILGNFTRIGNTPVFSDGGFSHTISGNWQLGFAYTNNMSGTIDFNGTDQTISASDFNNIIFSNGGTKQLLGDLIIDGNLSINSGVIVDASIRNIEMAAGNWSNTGTGTFVQSTGAVSFTASSGQTINANPNNVFGTLNIDNSAASTVVALSDIAVSQDFDLIQNRGDFNLQTNTLSVGRNFIYRTGTSFLFTLPATINFTGSTDQDIRNFAAGNYPNLSFSGTGEKTAYDNGLDILGGVTITNTTFDGANLSHSVAGDWTNNGNFQHTQAITFDGADQTISASTFHDAIFNGTGTKTLAGNISLNGRLQIDDGVTLDASVSDYKITVEESWTNTGTGVFVPRNGVVEFSGGYSQIFTGTITGPAAGKQFWDVLINTNTSRAELDGDLVVENDFSIVSGAEIEIDGFDIYVAGSFTNDGNFDFNSNASLLTFNGSSGTHSIEPGGSTFRYITFDASGASYELQSDLSLIGSNNSTILTIANGTFDLNGNSISLPTNATLNIDLSGGVLEVDANATLRLGRDSKITNSGGTFRLVGTTAFPAVVNSSDPDVGDYYSYDQTAGTIEARYYSITNCTGNGFNITGGTIDATNNFSDGTFSNGAGTAYLTLDLPFSSTVNNVIFNVGPTFNVSAPVDRGGALAVDFQDALGSLSGEANDSDLFDQITWSFSGAGIAWDGGGDGIRWDDPNNWSPNGVPGIASVVNLDHSLVPGAYAVEIQTADADAVALKLIIDAGGANDISLTVKNSRLLDVEELLLISDGSLIQENTSTIRLAGAFSNAGTYTANSNTFILDGSSGVFNINTNTDPFYNLTVDAAGAQYNLQSNTQIDGNINLLGGTFNVVGSRIITLLGNWNTNGGTFIPGTGAVRLSGTGATQTVYGGLFFDLDLRASADKQLISNVVINDDFIVNSGFTGVLDAQGFIMRVADDWLNNVGAAAFVQTGSGAVILDGGNQVIGGTGSTTFNTIYFSGNGTKDVNTSISVNGDFNMLNGVGRVDLTNGVTVTGTGSGTLSQTGGQLRIEGPNNFPSGFGIINLTAGEVFYYSNSDQDIFSTTYFDLRVGRVNAGNTPQKNILGDITVNDDLFLNDTEVTLAVNDFTIFLEDALSIPTGGQQVDWGTVGGTGTLNHFGNYWLVDTDITSFNNLVLGGTGGKYMTAPLSVTGTVLINDGILLDMGSNPMTGTGSKSFTMLGASRVVTDNILDPLPAFPTGFGTYDLAPTTRVTLNGTGNQIVFADPVYGRLDIYTNGNATLGGDLYVAGEFYMNDNAVLLDGGFDIDLAGSINDIRDYTASVASTITLSGSDQSITNGDVTPIDYLDFANIIFAGSGTKTLTGGQDVYRISGDLTVNPGVIVTSTRDFELSGANFTNNGTFNHTANTINFNRVGAQTIDPGSDHSFQTTRFENNGTKTIVNNGLNIDGGVLEFASTATVDFGSLDHFLAITNINDDLTSTVITSNANVTFDRLGTQTLVLPRTWNNVNFTGSGVKYVLDTYTVNDVIIDNGVDVRMSIDNGITSGSFIVSGNWSNAGIFRDYTSTVAFESTDGITKTIDNNGDEFYNVTFNQTDFNARTYNLLSDLTIQEDLTIGSGANLDVNTFDLTLGNNDGGNPDAEQHLIEAGAVLTITPGSNLFFDATDNGSDDTNDADPTLTVSGTLNLVGTSGSLARIARSTGGNRIDIDILSGGTINARFYEISTLVDAGLDVQVGAIVGASGANNNFSDGTWSGINTAGSGDFVYLNFEADASGLSDVNNVTFNHGSSPVIGVHYNVRRSAGAAGTLTFNGTINGLLAGETYEDDGDGTKIVWPALAQTNWLGSTSSDWSDATNWDNGIPTIGLEAIIGLRTNNPIIDATSGDGTARAVTITNGILTIDNGNDLVVIDDVIIGLGTSNGIFAVGDATSGLLVGGGLTVGTSGIYIPGNGTITFNASGGTVTITPNNASLYNLSFTGAATYSVRGTTVDIDGSLNISNGTLTFDTNNYTATVGGDILNNGGSFDTSINGTVVLDGAAQTIKDVDFDNLTVDGSLTKTMQGTVNINDDLLVNSTLDAAASTLSMFGDVVIAGAGTYNDGNNSQTFYGVNWTGTGAYSGTGTIVFARPGDQNIYASKFNNLDISGTGNKWLRDDTDLTGNLTLRNTIGSARLNAALFDCTSGTGTMTVENGVNIYVLGANNFPTGFSSYSLDPTSVTRYEGTSDQIIRSAQYGNLYLLNSNTKTLEGDINVDGYLRFNTATLDVTASNYEIRVAGEWDNNNGGSFIARNGQVIMDGSAAGFQEIRADVNGTKDFYILNIDKAAGSARYLANGIDVTILNNLIVQNGGFRNEYTNRSIFIGGDMTCISGTIENDGKYVLNKASGTGFITANGSVLRDLEINTGGTYILQDALDVSNLFDVTAGTFNANGQRVRAGNDLDVVNISGTYIAGAGGRLELGSRVSLSVKPGATIELVGTVGSPVTITRRNTNNYNFSVEGTIKAQYYLFEYMGVNGIKIESTGSIDPTDNFSNGTFANGPSGGTMFNIENGQALNGTPGRIENVAFTSNPGGGASNVSKVVATSGLVEFYDALGSFAGASFENDPNDLIDWTGAETLTWTAGAGTNDWFTAGNWESSLGGNKVPTAVDRVIIDGTPVIQPLIIADATAVASTITVNFGAVLSLQTSSDGGPDLDIAGDLNLNGILITNTANDKIRVQGAWSKGGSGAFSQSTSKVVFASSGGVDVIDNSTSPFYDVIIESGNFQLGNSTIVRNDVTINAGATLDVTTTDYQLSVGGDFTNGGTFAAQQGELFLNASGATSQNIDLGSSSLYNLEINANSAATYLLTDDLTVTNDMSVAGGTLDLNTNTLNMGDGVGIDQLALSGNGVLSVGANGTISMGNNSFLNVGSGSILQLVGTNSASVASINAQSGAYGVNIASGGQLDAQYYEISDINATGLRMQSGSSLHPTDNLSNGTFSAGAPGGRYLLLENNLAADITLERVVFASGPAINARRLVGTNNYIFNDASGPLAGSGFEDDNPANGDTDGRIRWSYTSLNVWNGSTSADWNVATNWDLGNVPLSTNDVLIPAGTPNDPVLSTGATGLANDITLQVGATLSISGGIDLDIEGSFINSGTVTQLTGTFYVGDNWTNLGTFTPSAGTTVQLDAATGTISVETGGSSFCRLVFDSDALGDGDAVFETVDPIIANCDFELLDGTLDVADPLHSITLNNSVGSSNFLVAVGAIFNNGASFVSLNTLGTDIMLDVNGSTFNDLLTSGTGTMDLQSNVGVGNDLTLASAFNQNSADIALAGDFVNTGSFTAGTGAISFNGSTTQSLSSSSGVSFNDFELNNTSGIVPQLIFNDAVTVTGVLTLTDGIISTSLTDILHLNGGSLVGGSSASYVDGPFQITNTGDIIFPVGDGLIFARIAAESLTGSNGFRAQYFDLPAPNGGNISQAGVGALKNVSAAEYWDVTRTSGSTDPLVRLYWEDGIRSDILDLGNNDLVVAHYTAGNWQSDGQGAITGTLAQGTVRSSATLNTLNQITFGSAEGNNPLPVELISFDAEPEDNTVRLTWQTASEQDNDFFTLLRSKDNENYEQIGIIAGSGTSNSILKYDYIDERPLNGLSYYKLLQTDFDGAEVEAGIALVRMENSKGDPVITAYPNPFSGQPILINISGLNSNEKSEMVVIDEFGKRIMSQDISADDDGNIDIEITDASSWNSGLYIVKLITEKGLVQQKIIKL